MDHMFGVHVHTDWTDVSTCSAFMLTRQKTVSLQICPGFGVGAFPRHTEHKTPEIWIMQHLFWMKWSCRSIKTTSHIISLLPRSPKELQGKSQRLIPGWRNAAQWDVLGARCLCQDEVVPGSGAGHVCVTAFLETGVTASTASSTHFTSCHAEMKSFTTKPGFLSFQFKWTSCWESYIAGVVHHFWLPLICHMSNINL